MKKICYVTTISLTLKSFVIKSAEYLKEHTDWNITVICDNDDEEYQDKIDEHKEEWHEVNWSTEDWADYYGCDEDDVEDAMDDDMKDW